LKREKGERGERQKKKERCNGGEIQKEREREKERKQGLLSWKSIVESKTQTLTKMKKFNFKFPFLLVY
jgi:hypothetical protein